MTVLAPPLDAVSRRARPYPAHLLPRNGTGLLLFAAAYQGHNDAIHMARADMTCTCVDRDPHQLRRMRRLYPLEWLFVHADAWEYAADAATHGHSWSAVSVDTYLGDATDRSLASLDLWCSIADSLLTATIEQEQTVEPPAGWQQTRFPRTAGVDWLVLTHA